MSVDNQLKGNWGEQLVAAKLAACGCFIRHVPQGHDTGIDLYCETTDEGRPFLHFWCQVKVRSIYKSIEKELAYSAETKEMAYWVRQPAPVVIILLPDERQNENVPLFICLPQTIVLNSRGGQQTLKSAIKVEKLEDLDNFLKNKLPLETFVWEVSQGKVAPIKTVDPSYTVSFPTDVTHLFDDKLLITIKHTLWRLSEDWVNHAYTLDSADMKLRVKEGEAKEIFKKARPYMRALEVLGGSELEEGRGISGFFEWANRAVMCELDGNFEKAAACFSEALTSIQGDPNLRNEKQEIREGWEKQKKKMETHLERVRNKMKEAKVG